MLFDKNLMFQNKNLILIMIPIKFTKSVWSSLNFAPFGDRFLYCTKLAMAWFKHRRSLRNLFRQYSANLLFLLWVDILFDHLKIQDIEFMTNTSVLFSKIYDSPQEDILDFYFNGF